jgi:pimeloyl-ACP methyl ester carboxylesterase
VRSFTLSSIFVIAISIEAACVPLSSREPAVPKQGVSSVQSQPAPPQEKTVPNQPASVPPSSTPQQQPKPQPQPKSDAAPREAAAEKPEAQATSGLDAELTKYAYPFQVKMHELTTQGQRLKMAYIDLQPEKPNGRTVLLLHGKNFCAAYWEQTAIALKDQGFRVVAPDQIGFGKSSKPSGYQFSFQALAENTHALLMALEIQRAAVVGHSMGGMLATRFALMYPDATESLVLVNPLGLEDYRVGVPYRTIDTCYQQELTATPETIRAYFKDNYFQGNWKPEYDKLIAVPAGWTQNRDYPRVAWCAALTYDMIYTQPVVSEFPLVRAPTLLIIGLKDKTAIGKQWAPKEVTEKLGNFEELGKKTAAAIPNAKLVELPDVGHVPQIEAFDAFRDALLGFLASP